jgi:hypothetical protein
VAWETQAAAPAAGEESPLAGRVAFNLEAFERGVEQFFARLDGLGMDLLGDSLASRLAPWLIGSAAVTATALLFARRRRKPDRCGTQEDPSCPWVPELDPAPPKEEA